VNVFFIGLGDANMSGEERDLAGLRVAANHGPGDATKAASLRLGEELSVVFNGKTTCGIIGNCPSPTSLGSLPQSGRKQKRHLKCEEAGTLKKKGRP